MNEVAAARGSWWLANPWTWTGAGLALELLALGWGYSTAADSALRIALIWLALIVTGAGVVIRFQTSAEIAFAPRSLARLLLGVVSAIFVVAFSYVWIASWFDRTDLRPGLATILWLLTVPLTARTAWQTWRRMQTGESLARGEEAAALLLLFAAAAQSARWALPGDWYTLQGFTGVASAVALVGAPLTAVDSITRRRVASGIIVFHFSAILTAALTLDPAPWVLHQLWARIFSPYLQFMYLTNAYHFYSPEPGPASYLWFRLYFTDAKGQPQADWYKIPELDDYGRPQHGTALNYQRTLSITENTVLSEQVFVESPDYQQKLARRLMWTPDQAEKDAVVVGKEAARLSEAVPMHPGLAYSQQYKPPVRDVKRLVESYVRHVAHKAPELYADANLDDLRIRVYRVVHNILPVKQLASGREPNDPELYYPIYMGEFSAAGQMRFINDPFLYWVLPITRDAPRTPYSKIRDWARKHAGDPTWVRVADSAGNRKWIVE